jgi:hypothetical protein
MRRRIGQSKVPNRDSCIQSSFKATGLEGLPKNISEAPRNNNFRLDLKDERCFLLSALSWLSMCHDFERHN